MHQVSKIVVNGGAGRARVDAIDGGEDLRSGGMAMTLHQESHHRVTLRGATQAGGCEGAFDGGGIHTRIRIYLMWDFVKNYDEEDAWSEEGFLAAKAALGMTGCFWVGYETQIA